MRSLIAFGLLLLWLSDAFAGDVTEIKLGYLRRAEQKETISLIDQPAGNDGVAGATLGIDDSNTTGRFLDQKFTISDRKLAQDEDR